jgi:hypothetical protein
VAAYGRYRYYFHAPSLQLEDQTVFRKVSLALALMTLAGMASASSAGSGGKCFNVLWFNFCSPSSPPAVAAPEIDPASAMAGLTMLAGGLAVLRGRRGKGSKA